MTYKIAIPKTVQKQLDNLHTDIYDRVLAEIILLQNNPRPMNAIKMKNNQGYRMRIGDYRVLYDINDQSQIITLRRVGHRREIYRYE
ncbi:MAG TPA: type II toxin-antitoxin system RelE/ParE family toxin [Allocoleopsis sp.]